MGDAIGNDVIDYGKRPVCDPCWFGYNLMSPVTR